MEFSGWPETADRRLSSGGLRLRSSPQGSMQWQGWCAANPIWCCILHTLQCQCWHPDSIIKRRMRFRWLAATDKVVVIQWYWPRHYNTGKGGFVCWLKISWAMLGNIMERLGNGWKSENFIITGMVILAQRHRCRYRHTDVETSFCMVLHTALSVYRRMCISTWRCFYIRVSIDTTTGIYIRV